MKITKDMTIGQVVNMDPNCAGILMEFGMHCLWCPSATAETLEEACMVHGFQAEDLVDRLNEWFAANSGSAQEA